MVLGGVKSVTLHDTGNVEMSDLSSQVSFNLHCNFISLKQQTKNKFLNSHTVLSVDLIM